MGKIKVLETPSGQILKALVESGVKTGISSRGMGSLKPVQDGLQEVQSDFYLATAADIVADPSAPNAFVEGIMEGKEWVWTNGALHEKRIEEYKKEIERTASRNLDEKKLEVFKDFLSKL